MVSSSQDATNLIAKLTTTVQESAKVKKEDLLLEVAEAVSRDVGADAFNLYIHNEDSNEILRYQQGEKA